MARLLTLLVILSVTFVASSLRIAQNPRKCRYERDCALKLSVFCKPVRDSRGCVLRGCPCGHTPPVLKPNTCPVCIRHPCPCKCPTLSCPKDCGRNGWVKDRAGCNTCKCKPKTCDPIRCLRYCPNGYVYKNGCQTCQCKPEVCRPVLCRRYCPNGFKVDWRGCQTCSCKPERCPPVCERFCPNGFVLDKRGCQTCVCKPTKVCPPVCLIHCEHGNVLDENGCPTCRCKPAPKKCRFISDCAAVTCLGSPQLDADGCVLPGCPCGPGPKPVPFPRPIG